MPSHFIHEVDRTIDRICHPEPTYTVKAMFARALEQVRIEETQAKVARMETEAGLQKQALIEALGLVVRAAEMVRYGLEMGRIDQMCSDELSAPLQLLFKARDLHESSLQTIAYEKAQIEDMQRTLNDAALWEQTPHTQDSDCTVNPRTLLCTVCDVDHSGTCSDCGARAFHKPGCSLYVEAQ